MATTKKTSSACDLFVRYLRECGMRVTSERLSIIEVISKHSGLFTIDELHNLMSREAFPVSMATLYNTVELLTGAGLLRCLRLPDRQSALYRLDLDGAPRTYFICEECGAVKETNHKTLTRYISNYNFTAFTPRSFDLSIYGVCRKCQKLKNKQK